jgi:hypothetical protein
MCQEERITKPAEVNRRPRRWFGFNAARAATTQFSRPFYWNQISRNTASGNEAMIMRKLTKALFAAAILSAGLAAAAVGTPASAADTGTLPSANAGFTHSPPMALHPDHNGLGLGVMVGEPTELTMKYWLSDKG